MLAVVEEGAVAYLVALEVVGVLDIVAIGACSLCPLVVLVVFLSEFALTESRVGRSLEELLKFVDGVFGVLR